MVFFFSWLLGGNKREQRVENSIDVTAMAGKFTDDQGHVNILLMEKYEIALRIRTGNNAMQLEKAQQLLAQFHKQKRVLPNDLSPTQEILVRDGSKLAQKVGGYKMKDKILNARLSVMEMLIQAGEILTTDKRNTEHITIKMLEAVWSKYIADQRKMTESLNANKRKYREAQAATELNDDIIQAQGTINADSMDEHVVQQFTDTINEDLKRDVKRFDKLQQSSGKVTKPTDVEKSDIIRTVKDVEVSISADELDINEKELILLENEHE